MMFNRNMTYPCRVGPKFNASGNHNLSIQELTPMSITVGGKAPDFSAPAYFGGRFTDARLSDAAGKWAGLFFYPGDFTFVCPTEIVALAGQAKQLAELDAQVYLISVDSNFLHKSWEEHELKKGLPEGVPLTMVADPGGAIG